MGTKYSSTSIVGYNSAPPADDGSTAASNQVKWSTIKTKLPDPLKTAIEAINSGLVTALDTTARLVTTTDSTVAGDHQRTLEVPSSVTTTFTISLGDAATMANGYIVRVRNSSTTNITIGRVTPGDTIDGIAGNQTLIPGSSATYAVNTAGNGYVTLVVAGNLNTLLVGTATDGGGSTPGVHRMTVDGAGVGAAAMLKSTADATITTINVWNPATTGDNIFAQFNTEGGAGLARGTVDYNRAGSAVRYNTTCDGRLKTKNGAPRYDPTWIGNVAACIYDVTWKETGYRVDTFVAQDLHQVEPDAVKKGDDAAALEYDADGKLLSNIWGVDPSKLIAKIVLEVYALRQEFNAYKAAHP